MFSKIPEGSLIVVKDSVKKDFLKNYRKNFGLRNDSIIGLNELKKKFYFDYTNEAVFHVCRKYGCIALVAKMYLENIYYIDDKCKNEKVEFLRDMKRDLQDNGLLIEDDLFRNSLKNRTVVLYNLKNIDNYYEHMFQKVESLTTVLRINDDDHKKTPKKLYSFLDASLEIEFVACQIADLIKKGISPSKIKLTNVKSDYIFPIRNIMADFHIPINFESDESISSTNLVKVFEEHYDDGLEIVLEELKKNVHTPKDETVLKSIVDIVNSYAWAKDKRDVKDFILEDVRNISVPNTKYKDAIETAEFLETEFLPDEHVFLLNFNQGTFPITKKDEDYLNDEVKLSLHMSDSIDLNKKIVAAAREKILTTENLTVTYSKRSQKGELYISPVYDPEILIEETAERTFIHSDTYNLKELVKEKDENRKYGTTTRVLDNLSSHYANNPYMTYDNRFKGLPKEKLLAYLDNKLVLSYSSMNTYYLCAFRYYLDNILKMDEFDSTFESTVGSIFHRVLSFAFLPDFDFEKSWTRAIEEEEFEFKTKENFFLKILKDELIFIIDGIKRGLEYTELKNALYEQKITVDIDEVTTFKGFVDKILYDNFDGESVAAIIDYKTGTPELKLDNCIYGIDMQLPIYAYLLGKYEPLKSAKIGGFYIERILANTKDTEKKLDSLKLLGYSNKGTSILRHVDRNYADSKIIKSMKTSANGFYSYAKVLSDEEISKLIKIVEEKILEASKNIREAKFDINPKTIGLKEYGCKFCKYKDICFKTPRDVEKLKFVSKDEFLGGEQNADLD